MTSIVAWKIAHCTLTQSPSSQIACISQNLNTLVDRKGTTAALAYAQESIFPRFGFAITHTALHSVGEQTYHKEPDTAVLISYLRTSLASNTNPLFLRSIDGFIHGYLSAYIAAMGTTSPAKLQALCHHEVFDLLSSDPSMAMDDCAHAIGHAAMHQANNEISPALAVCSATFDADRSIDCYQGIFMENAFLYNSDYHPQSDRPYALSKSMIEACHTYAEPIASACLLYVGTAALARSPNDFESALRDCAIATPTSQACAGRVGVYIGSFTAQTSEHIAICKLAPEPASEAACRASVNFSLSHTHTNNPATTLSHRLSRFVQLARLVPLFFLY